MEALLKASEASALMGVSMRHVRRMAQSGALSYQIHMNAQNRPEYLFPLSSLPDAAQQKYFAEHAPAALPAATPAKAKRLTSPPPSANLWKPTLPRNAVKLGTG